MNSSTLNQGKLFKKYQKKIIQQTNNTIMQKSTNNSKKPSTSNASKNKNNGWGWNWWKREGMENTTTNETNEIQSLTQQLDKLLEDYRFSHNALIQKTDKYSTITTSNSRFSNNFVKFTTGEIAFVTDQGILKWVTSPEILDSIKGNFGYSSKEPINIGLPWLPDYNNVGTTIPTDPPLLTGTPINTPGQVALNAGQNVYVNSLVKNPSTKYVGCYRDKPESRLINAVPALTSNDNQGFIITASSIYLGNMDAFGPFRAFDQNKDTFWHSQVSQGVNNYNAQTGIYEGTTSFNSGNGTAIMGENISIQLPNAQTVTSYQIIPRQDNNLFVTRSPNSWTMFGSNDAIAWTKIDEQMNQDFTSSGRTYNIVAPGNYKYYLIVITKVGNNDQTSNRYCVQIAEWNLFISSDSTFTNENRAMNYDGGSYIGFQECKRRAMDGGFRYFGLQDVNDDGNAACLFSNDSARIQMYGESINTNMIPIWSSVTSGKTVTGVTLTAEGKLVILESGTNSVIWASPGAPPSCVNGGGLSEIVATYGANCNATQGNQTNYYKPEWEMRVGDYLISTSYQAGYQIGDVAPGCKKDFDLVYKCGNQMKTGNLPGEAMGKVLIADCSEENKLCNFKLVLQTDGNMCLYQGETTLVWATGTNGQQKEANSDWVASKGKTGFSYLTTGQVLAPGEWIGSDDGRLKLIMQSDGNLVLYTSTMSPGCIKKDERYYGGEWVNAVYEFAQQGNPESIQKMGYVDSNGILSEYPPELIGRTNQFITVPNFNSPGNDFAGMPLQNETAENCQKICADNQDCAGAVFDRTNNNCWLKDKNMFPRGSRNEDPNLNMYIRIPKVENDNSCSKHIVPIDSISWDNYMKSGVSMEKNTVCGLAKVVEPSIESTNEMKQQIADLAAKIVEKINNLAYGSIQLNNEMDQTTAELVQNMDKYKKINQDFAKQSTVYAVNISGILSETDQQVLQQNYNYMFWSVLAIGIIIIIMNMKKR